MRFWVLLPFPWKIGLVALLAGGLLTGYYMHRRALINQGKEKGRQEALEALEKQYGAEWQQELESIDAERQALKKARSSVEADKEELIRLRRQAGQDLSAGIRRLREEVSRHGQIVIAVPAGDLPERIRGVLADLRAADGDRPARGVTPFTGAADSSGEGGTP